MELVIANFLTLILYAKVLTVILLVLPRILKYVTQMLENAFVKTCSMALHVNLKIVPALAKMVEAVP